MSSGFESVFKEGMKSLNKREKTDMFNCFKIITPFSLTANQNLKNIFSRNVI